MRPTKIHPQINPQKISTLQPQRDNFSNSQQLFLSNSYIQLNKKICLICCEDNKLKLYKISDCEHSFCKDCCRQYVKSRMSYSYQLVCPAQKCERLILVNEKQIFSEKRQKQQINQSNKKDKKQYYFFNINFQYQRLIQNYIQKLKHQRYQNTLSYTCKKCVDINLGNQSKQSYIFCLQCQTFYNQLPQNTKPCPKCHKIIQKDIGCNHMVCSCKFQFCFLCLEKWTHLHLCQQRRPKRTGIFYAVCLVFKIILVVPLVIFITFMWSILAFSICLLSGTFFGMFQILIMMEKIQYNQNLQDLCKFLLVLLMLLLFPVIIVLLFIPGFFLPLINICWDQTIFLNPKTLRELTIRIFSCLNIIQLI